jgi:hypothetical protein
VQAVSHVTARARWKALAAIIACVLVALVLGCGGRGGQPGKEVPPSWTRARLMPGHVAHLGKNVAIDGEPRVIVCDDCHDVEQRGFASPGSKPCAKCHAPEDARHHAGSPALPTPCAGCHLFTRAEGGPETPPTCAGCHEKAAQILPSPPGKKPHASHVSERAKCTTCHVPHSDTVAVAVDCRTCHETTKAQHGQGSVCTTCHAPHASAAEAATECAGCHVASAAIAAPTGNLTAPKIKPVGPKVASHESCTTCHSPHAATKKDVASCASCHADHLGATSSSGKGHTQCTGCHAPHAPASAKSSCTNCHLGHTALGAPAIEPHAVCTNCHSPHSPKKSPAAACASCHANVHPKHPSVTKAGLASATASACTSCHEPHPPAGAAFSIARTCTSCHGKLAKDDGGVHAPAKVQCIDCHQTHEFALSAPSAPFCGRCHTKVVKQLVQPGHADCIGCHGGDAHAPAPRVACSSCHTKEATTAPKGHDACNGCHSSHGGALIVGAISKPTALAVTAAFCTSCHANKKAVQHAAVPGGCASCHRPHGPSGTPASPPCTSCHAPASLPGLHLTKSHAAKCESCHGGHTAPSASRETCTGSCHAAQKTHQPGADTCQGCHIFRK